MSLANAAVAVLLKSPLHSLLSGKLQLIRYHGRRSGIRRSTPTQYVELDGGAIVVLVGNPPDKQWWKNFVDPYPLDLLVRGEWRHTVARTRWRHDDPTLIDAASEQFGVKYGRRRRPDKAADTLIVMCDMYEEPAEGGQANYR